MHYQMDLAFVVLVMRALQLVFVQLAPLVSTRIHFWKLLVANALLYTRSVQRFKKAQFRKTIVYVNQGIGLFLTKDPTKVNVKHVQKGLSVKVLVSLKIMP